jgi:hypothetical protein
MAETKHTRIDTTALDRISPEAIEDAQGDPTWPGGAIGALVDGYLEMASDVGRHNGAADRLIDEARAELRAIAAELRAQWADYESAVKILSDAGIALGVHSQSGMQAHATEIVKQFEHARRMSTATITEYAAKVERLRGTCERALRLLPYAVDGDWLRESGLTKDLESAAGLHRGGA